MTRFIRTATALVGSALAFWVAAVLVATVGGYLFPAGEGAPLPEGPDSPAVIAQAFAASQPGFKLFRILAFAVGAAAANAVALALTDRGRIGIGIGAVGPSLMILVSAYQGIAPLWISVSDLATLLAVCGLSLLRLGRRT